MSIYGTGATIWLENAAEEAIQIHEQVVGAHIREPYDWLPPPRPEVSDDESYQRPRAVVFVLAGEPKGGPGYSGQQYHQPLLVLSGEEYERATWRSVIERLNDAIEFRDV